jgi:hypothetical protein
MRVQVRVHRDVVRLRFKHCLVCRAVELCLCENCVNSCECWNAGRVKSGRVKGYCFATIEAAGPKLTVRKEE